MTKYVTVLEEWDDMVGDDWEHPECNYLNPNEWLEVIFSFKIFFINLQIFGIFWEILKI